MSDTFEIKKSIQPMYIWAGGVLIFGIVLLIFATSLFRAFDDIVPADMSALTRLARWIIVGVVVFSILTIRANIRRISYCATQDSIIVARKMFGSLRKKNYSIRSVTSVEVSQSYFGSLMNYGDIVIRMDRLGNTETLVLTGVDDPDKTLDQLQKFVKHIRR